MTNPYKSDTQVWYVQCCCAPTLTSQAFLQHVCFTRFNAVPASSDCNNMEAEPADDADFHNIRAVYFCNAIIQLA